MADDQQPPQLPLPQLDNQNVPLPVDGQQQRQISNSVSMMDTTETVVGPHRTLHFTQASATGALPWISAAKNIVNEDALRTAAAAAASADAEEYHQSDPAARLQLDSGRLPLFFGSDKDTLTPDLWIERVERTASLHMWSEKLTLDTAVNALRDEAAKWYNGAKILTKIDTWGVFRFNFLACLGKQQLASVGSFAYLLNMLKPKQKGESLISVYNRISTNIQKFLDVINSDLNVKPHHEIHDPLIMSLSRLPGAPVIPPAL